MTRTENSTSIVTGEYSGVIAELIRQAVAPPLEQFQTNTTERFSEVTVKLLDAREHLVQQSDAVGIRLESTLKSFLDPAGDKMNDIQDEIKSLTAQLDGVGARLAQYQEALALLGQSMASYDQSTKDLMVSTERKLGVLNDSITQQFEAKMKDAELRSTQLHAALQDQLSGLEKNQQTGMALSRTQEDELKHFREAAASQFTELKVTEASLVQHVRTIRLVAIANLILAASAIALVFFR